MKGESTNNVFHPRIASVILGKNWTLEIGVDPPTVNVPRKGDLHLASLISSKLCGCNIPYSVIIKLCYITEVDNPLMTIDRSGHKKSICLSGRRLYHRCRKEETKNGIRKQSLDDWKSTGVLKEIKHCSFDITQNTPPPIWENPWSGLRIGGAGGCYTYTTFPCWNYKFMRGTNGESIYGSIFKCKRTLNVTDGAGKWKI